MTALARPSLHTDHARPRRWTVMTALVIAGALAFSGCAGASKVPAARPTGTAHVVGDTLTVVMQAPATGMNPGVVDTAFVAYTMLAYEPVIYRDARGALTPGLAEKWDLKDGNTRLDLTIRKGVSFSDGTLVDAAAVKKSLEYMKGAKSNQAQFLATVTSIEAADAQHLTIKLSAPNPMLPAMLTQNYGIGQVISPRGIDQIDDLTVSAPSAGAGPYVYDPKQSVAGDHYVYTANPQYYAKDRRQHYKKVVLKVIANPQATLNALKTKQVQVAAGDFSTAKQAKSAGLDIAWVPFVWSGLNLIDRDGKVSKPLGDVRVRQAINFAIDRETLVKATLGEYGVVAMQPSVKGMDGYSEKAANRYPYDVSKAKALLAEAGYPNGFDLPVLSVHFAGIDKVTEALVPMLGAAGIRLKPTYTSDAQSYIGGMTDHKWPAAAVGYGSQPMYLMGQGLFLPNARPFNGFGTDVPELVKMYRDAAAAPPAQRAKLNVAIEDYLVENAWFAPILHAPVFYYSQPTIGGVEVSGAAPVASITDWYQK